MPLTTDESTLKLHVAPDGLVWLTSGASPAQNTQKTVAEFLELDGLTGFGAQIRIVGIARNAPLISGLHLRRARREVVSIELAGPNILRNAAEADFPEIVFRRMRSVTISSAAGGWHQLSSEEYPVYAMLSRDLADMAAPETAMQTYFRLHPAYRAASFIPTLSVPMAAQLFCTIIDPRWYVDTRSPDRTGKLELYLGLTPRIQAQVSSTEKKIVTGRRAFKCAGVLATWKTKPVDAVDKADPANFLYRIHAHYGGGYVGDLRASQSFIRYIRHNWLAAIEKRQGPKDGLFIPERFFLTEEEQAAYKAHISNGK